MRGTRRVSCQPEARKNCRLRSCGFRASGAGFGVSGSLAFSFLVSEGFRLGLRVSEAT